VWLLRRYRYARHHEPYPMTTLRIDYEYLAIEGKPSIQARVTRRYHLKKLSH
jgi:hypothetical protein